MRIFKEHRKKIILAAVLIVTLIIVAIIKPGNRGGGYDPYFARINAGLKDHDVSSPVILIDLDRLDSNIQAVNQSLKPPMHLRIVTKSLPSMDLIKYIMGKTGSRRLMAFHQPYLNIYINGLDPGVDILMGKPVPVQAAKKVYLQAGPGKGRRVSSAVAWLVDTPERLKEYIGMARSLDQKIRVSLEIDIGLHRGGTRDLQELEKLLAIIRENRDHCVLHGFMGYDGHVPHIPALFRSRKRAVQSAFTTAMESYSQFREYLKKRYPDLYHEDLVFNSGGSKSYPLFTADYPANDVALGGAFVKSATYDIFTLESHKPALFIATPVLRILEKMEIPFAEFLRLPSEWWDPNTGLGIVVYGGGWAASYANPPGLQRNAILSDPANENLMPNQSIINGSRDIPIEVGDFIFYRPKQSDAMFQFENILLLRDGMPSGAWKTIQRRY